MLETIETQVGNGRLRRSYRPCKAGAVEVDLATTVLKTVVGRAAASEQVTCFVNFGRRRTQQRSISKQPLLPLKINKKCKGLRKRHHQSQSISGLPCATQPAGNGRRAKRNGSRYGPFCDCYEREKLNLSNLPTTTELCSLPGGGTGDGFELVL